jgi:hypothetical protein
MDRRRGLTRAEILAVVGVVVFVVLMVLFTATKSRRPYRQPQAITCMANLKQWGLVFKLYTDDHVGRFIGDEGDDSGKRWFELFRPYAEDYSLCLVSYGHETLYRGRPQSLWGLETRRGLR